MFFSFSDSILKISKLLSCCHSDLEKQQILTFESNSPSFFMLWTVDRFFGANSTKGRISAGVPVGQQRNTQMEQKKYILPQILEVGRVPEVQTESPVCVCISLKFGGVPFPSSCVAKDSDW